ncbi:hypothetical protein D9M69_608000 [compost metagenome]
MFGLFIRSEHQAIAFFAQIAFKTFITQDRHFRQALTLALNHFRHGISNPVLVDNRNCGNIKPKHRAGLTSIVTGGRNNVLADDVTIIGFHLPLAARQTLEAINLRVEVNLGTIVACTFGKRHGYVSRCDMTVVRMIERSKHIRIVFKQRP